MILCASFKAFEVRREDVNRVPDLKYCLSLMKQGLTSSDLGMTDKYLLQGIPNMIPSH